ncbi:uncharacterized protein LOC106091228 isoform X2 [Stomoxys calcitrans]|uniref:Transmembrane protein 169 n=1 Tax=Stomoxys calcitrans TaxID=35570 RepID=A0A1I8PAP0_STOCA|nr:uncharacterized protein LOC106091228 isoform X2 [Stomoxys calcitrans]
MVADEMANDATTNNMAKERPVFIPPRKRQANKKANGTQNYVDHIANVQNRQKLSPSNNGLEEDLLNTKLLLKNKQPLPQIPVKNGDADIKSAQSAQSGTKSTQRHESSTVTPSSYSESSLDVKLSKSHDCLSNRSSSKKRVNIRTDLPQLRSARNSPDQATNYEDLESGETSVLNTYDHSLERYQTARKSMDSTNYLTMTGTIKRGRKKGQSFDLQLNLSRDELEKINAVAMSSVQQKKENLCCKCSLSTGLHVFLLSLICLPFVSVISGIYSFYIGTITWYNVFNYMHEEKSIIMRLLMSPILVAAYPIYIVGCSFGLALYSGFVQLSFQFSSWANEIADVEKGFYGWLCSFLHLSDCSPYEVVILTDIREESAIQAPRLEIQTSNEELTL